MAHGLKLAAYNTQKLRKMILPLQALTSSVFQPNKEVSMEGQDQPSRAIE
jgi:hypothetical protein